MLPLGQAGNRFRQSYKVKAVKKAVTQSLYAPLRRMTLAGKLRARSPVWIHFGCGEIADGRFINVDARFFSHIDYVTKSPAMPALPERVADLIYACHVFEHISFFQAQDRTLARWHRILKPGGTLMLSVPDFDKTVALYRRGERSFDWMQSVLMGGQEYSGNFHFALFTRERLTRLLEGAGFSQALDWQPQEQKNWPRDWSWDESLSLNLCARKL